MGAVNVWPPSMLRCIITSAPSRELLFGVHDVDGVLEGPRRVIDGDRWIRVHAVVAENLIHRYETRGEIPRSAPRDAVVGRKCVGGVVCVKRRKSSPRHHHIG